MSVCLKCGFVPDEQRLGVDVTNAAGSLAATLGCG